jgi:hypothetical protein
MFDAPDGATDLVVGGHQLGEGQDPGLACGSHSRCAWRPGATSSAEESGFGAVAALAVAMPMGTARTGMAKTPCLRDQRLGLTQRLDLPAHGHERRAVDTLLPPLGVEDPDA